MKHLTFTGFQAGALYCGELRTPDMDVCHVPVKPSKKFWEDVCPLCHLVYLGAMTPTYRATLARKTLEFHFYEMEQNRRDDSEEEEVLVSDLIVDMMHFCCANKLGFDEILDRARELYEEEI